MSLCYRYELKYFMRPEDARALECDLRRFMKLDNNTDQELGYYPVTSLYFDSLTNQHYDDKTGGIIERKKIRLRTYGLTLFSKKNISLEIKHKFELRNAKTRLVLTHAQAKSLIQNGPRVLYKVECNPHDREIVMRSFNEATAHPAVYVRYKRRAYVDGMDGLRVTFDYDIEGTVPDDHNICRLNVAVNPFQILLEVKFQYVLPPWFAYILESYNLDREAHSKFTLCVEQVNRFNPLPR